MKIPLSIRRIYDEQYSSYNALKDIVDRRMTSLKDEQWHYESRIKQATSFCLKLEAGKYKEVAKLDDFLACTLVIRNATEFAMAESRITEYFTIRYKRPEDPFLTYKAPYSFPFDDLRIYATLSHDPYLPSTGLEDLIFEIQVKTFLQHAWAISTHDLVYKTDNVNWGKERIAYQIKATLEHVELSIFESERLAQSNVISKSTRQIRDITSIITIIKRYWNKTDLPADLRKLAGNIFKLLTALHKDTAYLEGILNKEKGNMNNNLPLNLSPFGVIVQSIIKYDKELIIKYITKSNKNKFLILLYSEIELPPELTTKNCKNAIII